MMADSVRLCPLTTHFAMLSTSPEGAKGRRPASDPIAEINGSGQRDAKRVRLSLILTIGTILQEGSTVVDVELHADNADNIQPVNISHHVDEIREGDRLVERYNYVVYEFENDDGYLWARAYLDEVDKVAIYGPFADSSRAIKVSAPSLETAVINYLKRRFACINRLSPDEYAPAGYETIWRRSASD
ncbi:hypothetical protein T8S45_01485 [Blastomonas marina]|uniref:hypothetical protein n=1 Tax=Blastomonas marina TaxID=1867408 RepID=UPI002AC96688|nr:hypothetical protein [Blastomonas marina]WPZ04231.1 hypothetical protein T8S45_01485 [Blastomonas marina]